MTRQEEEEAQILEWADGLHAKLEEIFEKESVKSDISKGDLVFRVTMRTPLPGRKNARGLLQILVAREALDDYLLQEHLGPRATEKFLNLIRAKRASYVPKPYSMNDADVEKWPVRPEDVSVR